MIDWAAELTRCTRCGACREVCPVFALTLREPDVARGRLARIEAAAASGRFTHADRRALTRCLQCGRCREVCKADVHVAQIVRDAKYRSGAGMGAAQQSITYLLADPERLRKLTDRARQFAVALGRATADGSGTRLRFAFPYLEAGRYLPKLPQQSYLSRMIGSAADGEKHLALFLGCGAGRIFTGIGEALDAILATMNLTAAVPEQACCGLPAWGLGVDDAAREALSHFLQAFGDKAIETILSPCASCTAMLQQEMTEALADTPLENAARIVAEKVSDVFVWLRENDFHPPCLSLRVAVHVPCHTRRGVRGGDALTPLLRTTGAQIIELPAEVATNCCGMGGSFGVFHPQEAQEIGYKKMAAMLSARPDVIVTSCTGCLLQLRDLADHFGATVPVRHGLELLSG
ncbi:MAG TPA: (Fe-S)-binding protein [bacterium]|nr:(Fe-S)-binding protein [bacterium]